MLTKNEITAKIKLIDNRIECIKNGMGVFTQNSRRMHISALKVFKKTLNWSLANYDEDIINARIVKLEETFELSFYACEKAALMKVLGNDTPDFERVWEFSKGFDKYLQ